MFCSRCGARLPDSARFCERCGHRVEEDGLAPGPAGRSGSGVDRRLLASLIGAAAIGAVVVVLAVTGVLGNEDEPEIARSTPSPAAPAPSPSPSPASTVATPDPTETAEARTRTVRATVQGTCGRDGVGGDCVLSVRTRPAASSTEIRRLSEGDSLTLTCQVRGERVYSSALGASSTVWSKVAPRGYVANVYVSGPDLDPRRITLPRC